MKAMLICPFTEKPVEVNIKVSKYVQSGNTAILLSCKAEDGDYLEPYANLTVDLPDIKLNENEIIVKLWRENEGLVGLLETAYFEDTGRMISTGVVLANIWLFKPEGK